MKPDFETDLGPKERPHILLIDDDPAAFDLICEHLRGQPFRLDHEPDAERAVRDMLASRHDLYLLDYRLEKTDGLEVLQQVRGVCRRPIIVLTVSDDPSVDEAALEYGAADFIPKRELAGPILERSIRYALNNALLVTRLQQANRELARAAKDHAAADHASASSDS